MLILVFTGIIVIISLLYLLFTRNRHKDEPPLASGSKIFIGHALQYAGNSMLLGKMLILVLTGIIGIISLLYLLLTRNRHKDEPPLASGSKIFIGHALQYAGNSMQLWSTVKKIAKEALDRGGVLKTTVGPRTLYVVTNPEDCLTISNICLKKEPIYDFTRSWIGDGLITSAPSRWKVQRKLLNPAFSQHVLDNFLHVFNKQSRCLVNNLRVEAGKGPFDHWSYTKYNGLETVCLTTMGVNLKEKSTANEEYVSALSTIFNILITRFQYFWLHNNFLFSLSSLKRKQDRCIKVLHDMGNKVIKQKREVLEKEECDDNVEIKKEETQGRRFKPFMELLLELSRDTNAFTDREIREHVDTMIVAGHDSVAVVMMYCMLFVGSNPRVQKKIQEELKNIFGDENRDVTKQDLSQLVYIEAALKETMRICPSVPVIGRYLDKDVKLQNCTLYKGNSAFLFIYGMHRHSTWGPDADEFKPDRWLDASTLPDSFHAFGSFGIGRRNCIAQNYAMMLMKVTLSHVFQNYILHSDASKLELKLDVTLKPTSGHYISIENRH